MLPQSLSSASSAAAASTTTTSIMELPTQFGKSTLVIDDEDYNTIISTPSVTPSRGGIAITPGDGG